ncbi:hypothetical protein FNV43_RR27254 [Rhamnella rubrinervis]|uniref:Uncharacterized protein n=1 Tax=Rhamnella rubrinervis TaxID=2594499 RepID=A0A8K0DQX8_9ROSA|nr:hypothetical protein FNV43_RR27254 [Rhamnella rubrinervis]
MPAVIRRFLDSAPIYPLQLTGKGVAILDWPHHNVVPGLRQVPLVVDAIKNIKAGKRPASDPPSGGATNKSRKMVGGRQVLIPSSPWLRPNCLDFSPTTSTRFRARVEAWKDVRAYQAMVIVQQLKDIKEELSSSRKCIQVLEGKCKMLEKSFNIKENEKVATVTRVEVAEKGHSQIDKKYHDTKISLRNKDKELEGLKNTNQELSAAIDEPRKDRNENVMLGYSIMRRVVARDQDPPHTNEPAIRPSEAGPSSCDQGVIEVSGKAAEIAVAEKASEEEKN